MANASLADMINKAINMPNNPGWEMIFTWQRARLGLASWFVTWWVFVHIVKAIGSSVLLRKYRKALPDLEAQRRQVGANGGSPPPPLPFVTILRPIKGLDAHLNTCLRSAFNLTYPKTSYELLLCLPSADDPALPTAQRLVAEYPEVNARVLIGEEPVGPNPKIRNLSRGYREAKGDILWVLDSNVWVSRGTLERSVKELMGDPAKGKKPYKLVHHLPLAVDTGEDTGLEDDNAPGSASASEGLTKTTKEGRFPSFGGRLEETFLSTSHAQFYVAINTVDVAPCLVGKSNLFRKSHVEELTRRKIAEAKSSNSKTRERRPGILYFSDVMCEDHLIGDMLYYNKTTPELPPSNIRHGNHLLGSDVVIQPIAHMSWRAYLARRTRWLRVRKYTVLAATMVEPGTESIVCCTVGWYGIHTLASFGFSWAERVVSTTGGAKYGFILNIFAWCAWDRLISWFLMGLKASQLTPPSTSPSSLNSTPSKSTLLPPYLTTLNGRRPLVPWLLQWIGREVCALPIWISAMVWSKVRWRDAEIWISPDTIAREVARKKD